MHYFRTTSVQVRRLQVRSRGIRVCVCFLSSTPREKKGLKQPFEVGMGGKKGKISYSKTNSQVLETLDWRAECASETRAHLCRRCVLPLLHSGWVCTPRCSPPPSAVIGHVLGTGAVGGQRQQSNYWAMLSEEWIKKKVNVVIVDLIKTLYAAQSSHRIRVGTCASTDLITGSVLYWIKRWL